MQNYLHIINYYFQRCKKDSLIFSYFSIICWNGVAINCYMINEHVSDDEMKIDFFLLFRVKIEFSIIRLTDARPMGGLFVTRQASDGQAVQNWLILQLHRLRASVGTRSVNASIVTQLRLKIRHRAFIHICGKWLSFVKRPAATKVSRIFALSAPMYAHQDLSWEFAWITRNTVNRAHCEKLNYSPRMIFRRNCGCLIKSLTLAGFPIVFEHETVRT